MNTDTAKSILIANLKGSKRKRSSLITIAEATRTLIRKYGSARKVASVFDVSRTIIESFDKINDQPTEIKKLIEKRKILLDASTKLSSISDTKKRIELANAVAGLTAFDTRYIIDYWKKHPELSPEECKKIVFDSKPVTEEIHVIVAPLEAKQFDEFQRISRMKGLRLEEAAKIAVEEWIMKQKQGEEH
jgi:hypothetical protein